MSKIIISFLLIFLLGCTNIELGTTVSDKEKVCTSDNECVLAPTKCSGCSCGDAINNEFRDSYMKRHQEFCREFNGGICDMDCEPRELKCVYGICSVVPSLESRT